MSIYKEAADAMSRGTMQQHREIEEQVDWRNVNFAAPPSAPPHGEIHHMERLDHDQAQAHAENIRQAIAQQPTVEQGVAALFQAISTAIHDAVENGNPNALMALAKHVDGNARDWSDAILANTQAAPLTASPRVPEMPLHVQDAFKSHGTLQHDAEQAHPPHPVHPEHPPHPVHPVHPDNPDDSNEPPEPTPAPEPAPAPASAVAARQQRGPTMPPPRSDEKPAMKA